MYLFYVGAAEDQTTSSTMSLIGESFSEKICALIEMLDSVLTENFLCADVCFS